MCIVIYIVYLIACSEYTIIYDKTHIIHKYNYFKSVNCVSFFVIFFLEKKNQTFINNFIILVNYYAKIILKKCI